MNSKEPLEQIQLMNQTLQVIIYQKQALELELSETESSLAELENSSGEIYKLVGQLMLKADRDKIKTTLIEKQKFIESNISKLSDKEQSTLEKIEAFREKIVK